MDAILSSSGCDMALEAETKVCALDLLDMLFIRLTDNDENQRMLVEFGPNNRMEVECFK